MSWAEVKKINSDFTNEPLNFNNYINDISVFGADSYVMKLENANLFRMLISQSLTLFGHDCIHDYVYERMTEEDVDYMLRSNARLGQAMNSFYKTDIYNYGDIDSVLGAITPETYNTLEVKIQDSITRYISEKTKDETAASWLLKVFPEVPQLANYTTLESIIADTEFINNVLNTHLNLMTVICNSYMLSEYLGDKGDNLVTYPFANTTTTVEGITFTDNGDGTVTAGVGTLTSSDVVSSFTVKGVDDEYKLSAGTYELKGCPTGGDASTGYSIVVTDSEGNELGVDNGEGVTFVLEEETQLIVTIVVRADVTEELIFTPEIFKYFVSLDDFNTLVGTVATSSSATKKLIDQLKHNNKVEQFVTNLTAMTHIAANEESMRTLVYDADTLALALNVPEVCEIIAASEVAIQVIEEECNNYWANEAVMETLKTKIDAVAEYLPSVPDSAEAIEVIGKAVTATEESIEAVNAVTSKADKLAQGIDLWFSNESMMTALFANDAAYQSIVANEATLDKVFTSTVAVTCALESSDAHANDLLTNNATQLYGSAVSTQGLLGSNRAKKLIWTTTAYKNTFKSSIKTSYCGDYLKTYTFTPSTSYDYTYSAVPNIKYLYIVSGAPGSNLTLTIDYGSNSSSYSTTTSSITHRIYYGTNANSASGNSSYKTTIQSGTTYPIFAYGLYRQSNCSTQYDSAYTKYKETNGWDYVSIRKTSGLVAPYVQYIDLSYT